MNVISASDRRYLPGLLVTWSSILLADADRYINFYLLHDELSEDELRRLVSSLRRLSERFTLTPVKINSASFEGLPGFFFESKMTYARLLAPDVVPVDRAVYVDTDILCLRGVSEAWDLKLESGALGACAEYAHGGEANEALLRQAFPDYSCHTYFNAGLLSMDLASIRRCGLFRRALEVATEYKEAISWWDQSALNLVFAGKCAYLDADLNYQLKAGREMSVESLALAARGQLNLHYVAKAKPWMFQGPTLGERIFRTCASCCEEPCNIRDQRVSRLPLLTSMARHHLSAYRLLALARINSGRRSVLLRIAGDHRHAAQLLLRDLRHHNKIERLLAQLRERWTRSHD